MKIYGMLLTTLLLAACASTPEATTSTPDSCTDTLAGVVESSRQLSCECTMRKLNGEKKLKCD